MKVYILLEFNQKLDGEQCRVLKVYSSKESAEAKKEKLEDSVGNMCGTISFAIITKAVNGLLEFGIPSKGKVKVLQMTGKGLRDQIKVINQQVYIQHLEHKIKILKDQVQAIDNLRQTDLKEYIDKDICKNGVNN